jgi:hypothetical protein
MIGGIGVFLPFSQEEAEVCVADDAATTAEQSAVTVRKEEGLEQTLEAAQADEEENEHSEEWLNTFSQEAERAVALELTAKEAEEKMSILRNGSTFSAKKLKRLQHGSLQQKKKKKQTSFVLLICGNKLKPWKRG